MATNNNQIQAGIGPAGEIVAQRGPRSRRLHFAPAERNEYYDGCCAKTLSSTIIEARRIASAASRGPVGGRPDARAAAGRRTTRSRADVGGEGALLIRKAYELFTKLHDCCANSGTGRSMRSAPPSIRVHAGGSFHFHPTRREPEHARR